MTELKEKLINAIKSVDFTKLNIYELKTIAEISETVDKLGKKDYSEMLVDTMKNSIYSSDSLIAPKTIGELKEG